MYCPGCFNDTLKLLSSGVVKITFNGKSKSTSQFFYDLKNEKPGQIQRKLKTALDDYFSWYATLQNQDPIKQIRLFSSDFQCQNKCKIGASTQVSVVDLVISKKAVLEALKEAAEKHGIKLDSRFY